MKKTIEFSFEGFTVIAIFSKDTEPPYDSWELDDWNLVNNTLHDFSFQMLVLNNWDFGEVKERVEAACYKALEDYDEEDDKFDER
jgi:hypothetical protein